MNPELIEVDKNLIKEIIVATKGAMWNPKTIEDAIAFLELIEDCAENRQDQVFKFKLV